MVSTAAGRVSALSVTHAVADEAMPVEGGPRRKTRPTKLTLQCSAPLATVTLNMFQEHLLILRREAAWRAAETLPFPAPTVPGLPALVLLRRARGHCTEGPVLLRGAVSSVGEARNGLRRRDTKQIFKK